MAIIIAVLVTALFFMGFFSIYLRRCADTTTGGSIRPTLSLRRRAAASRGLSEEVITTFPTMAYSEVKDLKIGKGALECAVCLNEFEDDETLRLLPKCDHVFHPECIDLWLASHVTCPVCRADLVPKPVDSDEVLAQSETENMVEHENRDEIEVVVVATDQVDVVNPQEPVVSRIVNRTGSLRSNRPPRSGSVRSRIFGFGSKFPRSHSTGHSLVQLGENVDRYTLRLPEEVRKEIIRRALLNRTGSCAEPGTRKGHQPGEGSSRGKSYRRLGSLETIVKSDRWVFSKMPSFLSRALSPRGGGEGSTSAAAKSSEKSDEAGLVANDSAKLPV